MSENAARKPGRLHQAVCGDPREVLGAAGNAGFGLRSCSGEGASLCRSLPFFATMRGNPSTVDASPHSRAQEELRLSEQRYRSLVEATAAIVWSTPASGEFESEQPEWSVFTGQSFDQLK